MSLSVLSECSLTLLLLLLLVVVVVCVVPVTIDFGKRPLPVPGRSGRLVFHGSGATDRDDTGDTRGWSPGCSPNRALLRASTVPGTHVRAMADPRCRPKRASARTSFQWSWTTPTERGRLADSSARRVASAAPRREATTHQPVSKSCSRTRRGVPPPTGCERGSRSFETTAAVASSRFAAPSKKEPRHSPSRPIHSLFPGWKSSIAFMDARNVASNREPIRTSDRSGKAVARTGARSLSSVWRWFVAPIPSRS
mmetsp:Transcript_25405/g.53543  ORF Transcript_25405/g.53543 Transcript_25405/m.53543 type:complete len:253 (-) Transcript_25405:1192-1950(-)